MTVLASPESPDSTHCILTGPELVTFSFQLEISVYLFTFVCSASGEYHYCRIVAAGGVSRGQGFEEPQAATRSNEKLITPACRERPDFFSNYCDEGGDTQ